MSKKLKIIAWPCVIESEEQVFKIAKKLKEISENLDIKIIFKASFDKANRSSLSTFRGPWIEKWLEILSKVKEKFWFEIISDIHETCQIKKVEKVLDFIQIPAFLCRQTDLIVWCAKTWKKISIKKWQFLSGNDTKNIVNKFVEAWWKKENLILTERWNSFWYNNLVVDFRNIEIMKSFWVDVCFDATHSVQAPWGLWWKSWWDRKMVFPLAKAAVAIWVNYLFFETHYDPENALSDWPNMLFLDDFENILKKLIAINSISND